MRKIKVTREYYNKGDILFKRAHIDVMPGLSVLVGANGSGKTTLLNHIKHTVSHFSDAEVYSYNDRSDGGHTMADRMGFMGDLSFVANYLTSSEGENIILGLHTQGSRIMRTLEKAIEGGKSEVWLCYDSIDSGLSIDNVLDLKEFLFAPFIEKCNQANIVPYIIVTANEYEMAKNENCIDVTNMEYVKFKDYEDFHKFIVRSRKYKDKRYNMEG